MGYSKSSAIFNIVWGFIFIGFAIYFILCSFVLQVDAESWKHFMWGVGLTVDSVYGVSNIVYGIKTLIEIKEKNKSDKGLEDYDVYE